MSEHGLPDPIYRVILARYADIVRTGQMYVNDNPVFWDISGNTGQDLNTFCAAFYRRVRRLNSDVGVDEGMLYLSVYWVCKALSINYGLTEVMNFLRKKTGGAFVTIQMHNDAGIKVQYHVTVLPGFRLRVGLRWMWEDNILEVCPDGQKEVKGTLSDLFTEFDCPPELRFVPTYRLHFKLGKPLAVGGKKSLAGRVASSALSIASYPPLWRKLVGARGQPAAVYEVDVKQSIRGLSFEALAEAGPGRGDSEIPPSASSIGPAWSHGSAEIPVGLLRVHVVRGKGLVNRGRSPADVSTMFATCDVASQSHRTAAVASSSAPEWGERFEFSLRVKDLRRSTHVRVFNERGLCLGSASVPVSTVLISSSRDCSAVVCERLVGAPSGSLELELGFVPIAVPVTPGARAAAWAEFAAEDGEPPAAGGEVRDDGSEAASEITFDEGFDASPPLSPRISPPFTPRSGPISL